MTAPSSAAVTAAWALVCAAARAARDGHDGHDGQAQGSAASFRLVGETLVATAPADPRVAITWRAASGWEVPPGADAAAQEMLDLYLPLAGMPAVFGHIGQSLDGFIATASGESHYVTGRENIVHLHRLRALCDAIVVGANTVTADDPRLTTRLVSGANPLRVVLDPELRLAATHRVFSDRAAPTLVVAANTTAGAAARIGDAHVLRLPWGEQSLNLHALVNELRGRGCRMIFIEGGGTTVSRFLAQGLLDRLQVTIAPLFIGHGRPGIRVPPAASLGACLRPPARIFRMGEDVLFDCDLRAT